MHALVRNQADALIWFAMRNEPIRHQVIVAKLPPNLSAETESCDAKLADNIFRRGFKFNPD
jgi:hypothetical protein